MPSPKDRYWRLRLDRCDKALVQNGFTVFFAEDAETAGTIFRDQILPTLAIETASWGDSLTMLATGALETLRSRNDIRMIETFDADQTWEERNERRRQALLTDLFLTGTNAVTEAGQLVNLDMVGNRVTGLTFGPRKVVLFVGRNKIVPTIDAAMTRIKGSVCLAIPDQSRWRSFGDSPCPRTSSRMPRIQLLARSASAFLCQ